MKYRHGDVEVEAVQWRWGDHPIGPMRREGHRMSDGAVSYQIRDRLIFDGDWIIHDIARDKWSRVSSENFEQDYEVVDG